MKSRPTTALAVIACLALLLTACGGGGDDSPAASTSVAQVPLALTAANRFNAATFAAGAGETVLQIGQLAVDHSRRFAVAGMATSLTETCPNGGVVSLTLTDRDANGRASAGDAVTVLLRDCGVPLLGETLAGEVVVELAAAAGSPLSSLQGVVSLGALTIVDAAAAAQGVTIQLRGSLAFAWTRTSARTTLSVASTAADDLRIVGSGQTVTITDSIRAVSASKSLNLDQARSVVNIGLRYESESLGGSISVSTPRAVKAYLNTYPEEGSIEVQGARGGKLTLTPNFVSGSETFNAQLDANGDGVAESSAAYPWGSATSGYLWWDGTSPLNWSSQPYSTQGYLATSFGLLPSTTAPGVNETLRLQFTRELAATTTLYFRFADQGSTLGYDPLTQNVEAEATQQGALILIRPRQQLRHARYYELQVSTDGVAWAQNVTVQDALGNSLAFFNARVLGFATTDSLRAVAALSGPALSSPSASAQLSAAGSISTLRPIASYRWTQLSGTPLSFGNPEAATTQLTWGPVAPSGVENVVIELTVTDTAGEVERTRISVPSFNSATAGRLLYFKSSPGDYIGAGQTVVVSDTTGNFAPSPANSGYVAFNYNAIDYSSWWYLNLASADGSPLAVGAYENAVRAPFHGNQAGLELSGSGRGCNTLSGRFVVLELQTDAQGVFTQLAVDFEQHCEGPQAPPLFGSLRVNSAVPITQ